MTPNTSYEFYFNPTDIVGERARYVPGRYTPADGWEINVGANSNIDLYRMQVNEVFENYIDGRLDNGRAYFIAS